MNNNDEMRSLMGMLAAIAPPPHDDLLVVTATDYTPMQSIPVLKKQADRMERLTRETAAQCQYTDPLPIGVATADPMALGVDMAMKGLYYGIAIPFAFTDDEIKGTIAHEIYHLTSDLALKGVTLEQAKAEEIAADEYSFRQGFAEQRIRTFKKYKQIWGTEGEAQHLEALAAGKDVHETHDQRITRAKKWLKENNAK